MPPNPRHEINRHHSGSANETQVSIEKILSSAEKNCFQPGIDQGMDIKQYAQCRRKFVPSYINRSMSARSLRERRYLLIQDLKQLKQQLRINIYPQSEEEFKELYPRIHWYDYEEILQPDIYQKIEGHIAWFQWRINRWTLEEEENYNGFKELSQAGSLIVMSAGNNAPKPIDELKVNASREFGAILVGGLDPNGRPSYFSQQNEEVAIMAPGGYHVYSADQNESPHIFNGTSAAAPFVTGALAGFEWMSGYHPTAAEAKILLEKTAVPLLSSNDRPQQNGPGMLNAYKLGMVGARLKQICKQDRSCFQRKIQNPETYKFPEDEGLSVVMEETFPYCSFSCGGTEDKSCDNQAKAFERLRKAALLNPQNRKNHILLACLYKAQGFEEASEYHLNSVKALAGGDSRKTPKSLCTKDSDCVLAANCGQMSRNLRFTAMNQKEADIHYALKCRKSFCNGKCGCSNREKIGRLVYFARCVRSQCSLQTEPVLVQPPKTTPSDFALPDSERVPSQEEGLQDSKKGRSASKGQR